jgi:predicted enzyme related to lactoylglutathione lyase
MKVEVTLDCNDVERLADFWERVLGYVRSPTVDGRYITLEPREQQGFTLTLQQVPETKIAKNRMHLDLLVPDLHAEVERIERLGATRLTLAPLEQYGQRWFVMRDPEGNEFCLGLEPTA